MKKLLLILIICISAQQVSAQVLKEFRGTLDYPDVSFTWDTHLKIGAPYDDIIKDVIEYNQKQSITIMVVAMANLGAMVLLMDKYSWSVPRQKLLTPLVLFGAIGLSVTLTLDYHKRKRGFYNKYFW